MILTLEQMTTELLSLGSQERAKLAHILISSLDTEQHDFMAEWEAEIAQRVSDIDTGIAKGRPALDAVHELRARYQA